MRQTLSPQARAMLLQLIRADKEMTALRYAGDAAGLDRFLSAMQYLEATLTPQAGTRKRRISRRIAAELRAWAMATATISHRSDDPFREAMAFIDGLWCRLYTANELLRYRDRPTRQTKKSSGR